MRELFLGNLADGHHCGHFLDTFDTFQDIWAEIGRFYAPTNKAL
jgi:hypothetical protein